MTNALLLGFVDEVEDRLDRIESTLLESDEIAGEQLRLLRRELHTLKGSSAAMGFRNFSHFVHTIEDCADGDDDGRRLVELVLDSVGTMRTFLSTLARGRDIASESDLQSSSAACACAAAAACRDGTGWRGESQTGSTQASEPRARAGRPVLGNAICPEIGSASCAGCNALIIPLTGDQTEAALPCRTSNSRTIPFGQLSQLDRSALDETLSPAGVLMVLAGSASADTVHSAVRRLVEMRSSCGLTADHRLPILVALSFPDGELAYDLRNAGAAFVLPLETLNRGSDVLPRIAGAHATSVRKRGAMRFREWEKVLIRFPDGTMATARVIDESLSGIALEVCDVGPFEYGLVVHVAPQGKPGLMARIVRVGVRNGRGWCHVGLVWHA